MLVVLLAPVGAVAQEATPTASYESQYPLSQIMPIAATFGPGWTEDSYLPNATNNDYIADGFGRYFGGPAGRRVMIVILQNKTNRASSNDAWDLVTGWVDRDQYDDQFDIPSGRRIELDEMPLPAGVVDAERVDGTEYFLFEPMCGGSYAVDPDLLIYVKAQGAVELTDGASTEINACDDIAAYIAGKYRSV